MARLSKGKKMESPHIKVMLKRPLLIMLLDIYDYLIRQIYPVADSQACEIISNGMTYDKFTPTKKSQHVTTNMLKVCTITASGDSKLLISYRAVLPRPTVEATTSRRRYMHLIQGDTVDVHDTYRSKTGPIRTNARLNHDHLAIESKASVLIGLVML